ncbi:hypothetical protein ZWY2020_054309 [Hordeum vulgare]|nr:hypothetical protein ZWY2020_054309 [Hordeum vulgare]
MEMREWPLARLYELLHGEERDRWPPEARLLEAAHDGDVQEIKSKEDIAKELDVQGHGIRKTVASTTYMGMNAIHTARGGRLPIYRYLVEVVKMDVDTPDTAQEFTPVLHAIMYGHLPAVRYLLDHGADLHQQREKITLLHMAVVHDRAGHLSIPGHRQQPCPQSGRSCSWMLVEADVARLGSLDVEYSLLPSKRASGC